MNIDIRNRFKIFLNKKIWNKLIYTNYTIMINNEQVYKNSEFCGDLGIVAYILPRQICDLTTLTIGLNSLCFSLLFIHLTVIKTTFFTNSVSFKY